MPISGGLLNSALRSAALLCAAALFATGCASLNAAQTANTMGRGGLQLGLEPAVESFSGTNGSDSITFPRVDLAVRYGLTDSIDIGGKVGSSLFEINAKFQLTDPKDKSLVISLAPSLGGFVFGSSGSTVGSFTIKIPLLIGFGFGDGNQFVLGPNIQNIVVEESDSSCDGDGNCNGSNSAVADVFGVGLSVGVVFKLSDGFRLMPEVGVMIPIVGVAASGDGNSATVGSAGFIWQLGLTFLFGSQQGAQR